MSTARGERRIKLQATRSLLYQIPLNELFELPGRPHVVYQLRSYASDTNPEAAALQARQEVPFLFKAFETGQIGPKRMSKMHGGKPRMATIHEYLDWTVTAQSAEADDELDFGGFRVLVILPRYMSHWPAPESFLNVEGPKHHPKLGAPKQPLPTLHTHGKPVTAATIRSGPGYLEVPFVATHENKRGRGYCRCLVEALEAMSRALDISKIMLCSTNDDNVKATWSHLGFHFTSEEEMERWDIPHSDLVYLQNTTQMHKTTPPPVRYKPIVIRHQLFQQRTYVRVGGSGREGASKNHLQQAMLRHASVASHMQSIGTTTLNQSDFPQPSTTGHAGQGSESDREQGDGGTSKQIMPAKRRAPSEPPLDPGGRELQPAAAAQQPEAQQQQQQQQCDGHPASVEASAAPATSTAPGTQG